MGEHKHKKVGLKAAAVESTLAGKIAEERKPQCPLPTPSNGHDLMPSSEVNLQMHQAPAVPWWMRSEKRRALRAWFLARVWWPIVKHSGPLLCAVNRHDWKHAPAYNEKGEVVKDRPGNLRQCQRPACRIFAGEVSCSRSRTL